MKRPPYFDVVNDVDVVCAESSSILDLDKIKITLDFLCLTFRSDQEELVPANAPTSMRTTSFCSSSSGHFDTSNLPAMASQHSELSEDSDAVSLEDEDRTETISRQLLHIPEGQRRPVRAAVAEIEWMLKDEIVAFLLDSYPITEMTLEAVSIIQSYSIPSCNSVTNSIH